LYNFLFAKYDTLISGSSALPGRLGYEKKGAINLREFSSLEVKVINNDLERAMKVLKKKIQNDGLFRRLKLKKSYEKPSECRRRKRRESERRNRIARLKKARFPR
jgi:small subunit ribosomal protein S21